MSQKSEAGSHGAPDPLTPFERLTLGEYLQCEAEKRWEWGVHDCCTFSANWFVNCGQPDPMAKWRGRYANEAECAELIGDAGGLLPLWLEGLGEPTGSPQFGSIAVLSIWGHAAGGIYDGDRWIIRAEKGWVSARMCDEHVLGIWHREGVF